MRPPGGVRVETKSGEVHCGSLWEWRPGAGRFKITDDETGDLLKFRFDDLVSAVGINERVGIDRQEDVDLFKRRDDDLRDFPDHR